MTDPTGRLGRWLGPVSGILFVVAVVIGGAVFMGIDAEPSDPASAVLAELRENADQIGTAALLTALGVGFLLVFIGHLRVRLRDGGSGWAADVFLTGGLALAAGWMMLLGAQLTGRVAGANGHAEVGQAVIDFLWEGSSLFIPGLLAVGIAASAAGLAYRALPIWLGVFAAVVAVGALAPWLGILVFVGWVLAASLSDLIRPSRRTGRVTPA